MFSLTRKTDYALVALASLATLGSGQEQPRSARQIAQEYDLPLPLLMQVLKDLHRSGILGSVRGAGGGYYLALPPERISITDVIAAIEGQVWVTVCCREDEPVKCVPCSLIEKCPITAAMRRLNDRIIRFFSQITIRDLIENEVCVPLEGVAVEARGLPAHTPTT